MVNNIFSTLSYINRLFSNEIYLATKRFCRAQINSSIDFKPKNLQIILNDIAPNILHKTLLNVN